MSTGRDDPPQSFCAETQNCNCHTECITILCQTEVAQKTGRFASPITPRRVHFYYCAYVIISLFSVFYGKLLPAVMCHVPVLIEKPSRVRRVVYIFREK